MGKQINLEHVRSVRFDLIGTRNPEGPEKTGHCTDVFWLLTSETLCVESSVEK